MAITKKINCQNIFIFIFLVVFPFGQIIRIGILQPIDIVVGLAAFYVIFRKLEVPRIFRSLHPFLFAALFSWIISIFIFQQTEVLYGLLYLFRLIGYYFFAIYVWNFINTKEVNRKLLLDSLLSLSLISSLFGWLQFFTIPDIKPFFVWGWDMHLFRLVGTFLDPTFLGIIIVFGLLLSINRLIDSSGKKTKYLAIVIFLVISLAFTYSRASYLAFAAGVTTIIVLERKYFKLTLLVIALAVLALLLPTARNHSINLFRSFSAVAKFENYQTTLQIFSKSPVFGIGYNNMCIAHQKYIGVQDFTSHACSGSDSSLLFVLATTGMVGFMVFAWSINKIIKSLQNGSYFVILCSSFVTLFVHSLFSNSMFYPWIMGYLAILLAVGVTERSLE